MKYKYQLSKRSVTYDRIPLAANDLHGINITGRVHGYTRCSDENPNIGNVMIFVPLISEFKIFVICKLHYDMNFVLVRSIFDKLIA